LSEQVEIAVRLGFFGSVLLVMTLWELFAPRRPLTVRKAPRWASNLSLVVLNIVLARLLVPITAMSAAVIAQTRGWGLLHQVSWPYWVEIVISVLAFDLAIYLQHVMFHAIPVLWRLHMVHHADLDIDVTTGLRFHTFEILLSALIKLAVVIIVGPAAIAVVVFEVLLNATSMFNHSNVRMPDWLDRLLRLAVVTPDMHRVHHSVIRSETNSNFGFNLPWWDFLLGTYRAQPRLGHEAMTIGVAGLRSEHQVDRLPGMLLLPFHRDPGPKPDVEQPANPMDTFADEYDRWFDSPAGDELFRIELACIQRVRGTGLGRWLEVGVGTGRFASALGICEGVDPSESALLLARNRGVDGRLGTAEHLPYADGVFDGVLLVTTLCFLVDPQAAIHEFQRVLKPGGRLVIGMIPADSRWGELYAEKGRQGHPFYSTAHFFSVIELVSLTETSGFTQLHACSCLLNSPGVEQTQRVEDGVIDGAGFVCLDFRCREKTL
jgi:sterol desaturase/sphingolipid hydroxylase (fatty acid hydroxylase superfamily)/SAM-dependent methyltransferase